MTSIAEVVQQLRDLGVRPGGVLLVHTSFRAVGAVEGGPLGLIGALRAALGAEGTLVMPTMTDGASIFERGSTPTDGMGIVAERFWRERGVVRSGHPGASFAAVGPRAAQICAAQPLAPPHGPDSPVGRVHDLDGQVLLIGVASSESTTLHLAEAMAGVPYLVSHPCVIEVGGVARTVMIPETDHCCRRFRLADDWLRARRLLRQGRVGQAGALLYRARDATAVALERLAGDPLVFLCPAADACAECDAARASVAMRTVRLGPGDRLRAKQLFTLMADVFAEPHTELDDGHVDRLLARSDFWAIAAFAGNDAVGGITAHTLPMTRTPSCEIFIYDVAVREDHRRRGVGRRLLDHLRAAAAAEDIRVLFVPADDDDQHALDFYRALGGAASPVTIFTFTTEDD
jgi:aminoglycoside 3-N-acetyltransferase